MNTLIQSCANVGRLMFRTLVLTPCDYLLFGGQKIFRYSREELEAEVLAELEREGMLTKDLPARAAASGTSFPAWTDWDDQVVMAADWDNQAGMAATVEFDAPLSEIDSRVSYHLDFGTNVVSGCGADPFVLSWLEPSTD